MEEEGLERGSVRGELPEGDEVIAVVEHAELVTLDWTAIIVAGLVAIPATIGAWAALRNGRRATADKAEVLEALDTTNDKKLGVYVHDIAQQLEVISAQTHTNTSEVLMLAGKVQSHLDDTEPIRRWVEDQMEG